MAVTVTDTRITIDQADSTTGWTGQNLSPGTSTDALVYAEAGGCITGTLNIDTGQAYFTDATPRDLSNTLVYIWSNNFAQQSVWDAAAPPNAMHLGDGTNRISFKMSGSNRLAFAHLEAGTGGISYDWECLVLDGSQASTLNTNGYTVARAGSFASLNLGAITQFGSDFTTLSKGLGGGINVAIDIIRIGNDGLVITGGATGGTEGKFSEIVAEDRSQADLKAHGIIREYSTGIYGLQGPLTWGGTSTGETWFEDEDIVLVFENRDIGDDKYYLAVREPTISGDTVFILRNSTITTAGPNITGTFNNTGITTLTITGCNFSQWGNAITFANDPAASGHTVTGNTFTSCGQINPGDVTFQDNTIQNSTASATGAVLLDADGTANWSGLDFTSGGTGHAIYVTATGTYTFTNFTYSGYGNTGTTNAVVYNNSGGLVTINVSGGDTPTYYNGAGASTVVLNTKTITINVKDTDNAAIESAQVWIQKLTDDTDYGHPGNPFTAAAGNSQGDGDFVVTETPPSDLPSSGWIVVLDVSTGKEHSYRYASKSGNTFTFNTAVTGTDNGTGDTTTINETNIGTKDIVEGDLIRNTTDGQWATVLSVSTNSVTTTTLSGGASWAGDNYSVHTLAVNYVSGTDTATVPLMNEETNVSGTATEGYNYQGSKAVVIRIRKASSAPYYLPFSTTATITGDFTLDVTLQDDNIKS